MPPTGGDWAADGRDLHWGDLELGRFELSARGNDEVIEVSSVSGTFRDATRSIEGRFHGGASFESAWPPAAARLELEAIDPIEGVERVGIVARLDRGMLYLDPVEFTTAGHPATFHAALPLDSLSPGLAVWFGPTDQQGLRLGFDDLELAPLISLAGLEDDFPLRGKLDGELNLDLANLPASSGDLEIVGLAFGSADGVLESDATLRLRCDQGRLVLERTRADLSGSLIGGRTPLEIFAAAELNQDWNPDQGLADLISELSVELKGSVDTALLKRFAADGVVGHLLQVLDPAEEDLPYNGRTRFEGLERDGEVVVGRVEQLREDYRRYMARRRDRLSQLAGGLGWTVARHRTDRPPETALLALYRAIADDAGQPW